MKIEKRPCVDCGNEIEVFVNEEGEVSGGGRCQKCRSLHFQALKEQTPKLIRALDPAKHGSSWTEKAVCKNCGEEYEARYFNALGVKFGNRSGLCPDCFKLVEDERIEKERLIKEQQVAKVREDWRHSCGIPPKYYSERFSTWDFGRAGNVDKAHARCLEYAENYPIMCPQNYKSLAIVSNGIWGVGKTHLVYSIAHKILDRWNGEPVPRPVTCIDEPSLLARIRNTFNYGATKETEVSIIEHVSRVPLLILDDVGKEKVSDPAFVQRTLFKIINNRYNNMLPIVMTANMTSATLLEHLGGTENQATFDRLVEMCGGLFEIKNAFSYRMGL